MWKKVNKEQIKDYPVGTKVLVSGEFGGDQECVLERHWFEGDYGFMTDRNIYTRTILGSPIDDEPYPVFPDSAWNIHTVSVWTEEVH